MSMGVAFQWLCEIPGAMLASVSDPLVPPPQINTDNYLLKSSTKKWARMSVRCAVLATAGILLACTYAISASWNIGGLNILVEEYHDQFLKMGSNATIAKHLREITRDPHVAGTPENFATADYVRKAFRKYGLDAHYTDYQVLLPYPLSRSLSLTLPEEGKTINFQLKEKEIGSDPSTRNSKVIPTFHAYSPSGDVSAEVVYANYGREEDYITLQVMGVDVKGAIVVARYGLIYVANIIQNAANTGAIGVVVYSDPENYGGNRTQGYYPNTRWSPPAVVQRGSVYAEIGDPQTPGWPSVSGSERISAHELKAAMPTIPSMPISAEDAIATMKSLLGPVAPAKWQGALNIPAYRLGRGTGVLNLHYKFNERHSPRMFKDAVFQRLCEIPAAMFTCVSEPRVPQRIYGDNYLLKLSTKKRAELTVGCVFIAAIFLAYGYAMSASWNIGGLNIGVEEYHDQFLKTGSNVTIAKHLRKITQEPHVAGTPENFATADYVLSTFQKYGLDAHYIDYQVLLSYPSSRSLSLRLPEDGKIINFSLKEKEIDSDPSTKNSKVIPTFHAYSPSGDVSAEVVYANYGREEDYITLREMGVDVRGAIVIAKHGLVFRGDIVQNAANAGAIGAVVYSDPEDYGGNRTQGYYPNSRWLPPTGVQRGSLYAGMGDPQTPGWPSVSDSERIADDDVKAAMPTIPSIPISAEDATAIMKSLRGPVAPARWQGSLNIPAYRLGRGTGVLNLHYKENQTVAPIRNVFGLIKGSEEPDRYVLLGNHRDAWTFGAGDPNGGTAILLELAHRFGKLLRRGWKPRRSIILCNWDAEEYALIGSTEWVEQNYDLLFSTAVAYLNVDIAVSGPGFFPSSTPQLDDLLQDIAKQVKDPDNPNKTIYESWTASSHESSPAIGRLGGGSSDFAPFLQHVGIPAIAFRFGKGFPAYHSLYDDYIWMAKFGDPLFHRHVAVGAIWGLTALKLADARILPFNYARYADNLQSYVKILESQLKVAIAPSYVTTNPLHNSIAELRNASLHIMKKAQEFKVHEDLTLKLRSLNDHLLMAERAFTDAEGLRQHPWFKHLVYGPTRNNVYGTSFFPGVSDLIAKTVRNVTNNSKTNDDREEWSHVQHEIWRVSRAISHVALVIRGEFT